MKRRFRILPRFTGLALSLLITLTLVVPAAYLTMPHIYRWVMLSNLTAKPGEDRQQALHFVANRAGDDPRVREGALERLSVPSDTNFLQLVKALDQAGVWSRRRVADAHWRRWLLLLAENDKPAARTTALDRLANMPGQADHKQVRETVRELAAHKNASVRQAALNAAAQLRAVSSHKRAYERIVFQRRLDENTAIARQAWILIGLLKPDTGFSVNWRARSPHVAEAQLWAVGKNTTDVSRRLSDAARDTTAAGRVRAMALYAMQYSDAPKGRRAQIARIWRDITNASVAPSTQPAPISPLFAHRLARMLGYTSLNALGLKQADTPKAFVDRVQKRIARLAAASDANQKHNPNPAATSPATRPDTVAQNARSGAATQPNSTQPSTTQPSTEPATQPATDQPAMRRAALHALAPRMPAPGRFVSNAKHDVLDRIAVAEGVKPPVADINLTDRAPLLLRAASVAIMAEPNPALLEPLWNEPQPTMRNLACHVAAERLSDSQLRSLIQNLVPDLSDDRKRAGAMLAGLTGLETHLLRKRMRLEDVWTVKQLQRVGLWMQGRESDMGRHISGLLAREDMPRPSLLLAMLTRTPGKALEHLFYQPGYSDRVLADVFFDRHRWWTVLRARGPSSLPPFWYWADRPLQRFQVQVMRNWYLLHRHTLTDAENDA